MGSTGAGATNAGPGSVLSARGSGPRGLGIGIPQSSQSQIMPGSQSLISEADGRAPLGTEEERGAGWVGPEDISDEQHGR